MLSNLAKGMNNKLSVAVFGGHGFIGRYLLNDLGLAGSRVYLPYRGDEFEYRHVKPMFDLGQFAAIPFSPRDEDSIREAVHRADMVVNFIGKHYETKHFVPTRRADGKLSRINFTFEDVHANIPATIARITKECGIKTFIHVSALAQNKHSNSSWNRSKAIGEEKVKTEFPEAIIVRPATVFGAEDRFLNSIADTISRLPAYPLVNNGATLLQPVYAPDVAHGIIEIIKNAPAFRGKTFEFAGPTEYSYKEVAEFVKEVIMFEKGMVNMSPAMAKFCGRVLGELANPMFTEDQVYEMMENNVLLPKDNVLTFKDLDIKPASMDRKAFDYLHRFRRGGHFTLVRGYH